MHQTGEKTIRCQTHTLVCGGYRWIDPCQGRFGAPGLLRWSTSQPIEAGEIARLIRCPSAFAGRLPDGFGEAIHDPMLDSVRVRLPCQQTPIVFADAARLVGDDLFLDGDVHGHVQKRISTAGVGREIAIAATVRIVQQGVILGMLQDDLHHHGFDAFKRLAATVLSPGAIENVPQCAAFG